MLSNMLNDLAEAMKALDGKKAGSLDGILLLPAEVLQTDLRRTSMSVSVNTCFFSLCVPLCFLYSWGPFLAACFYWFFGSCFRGNDEAGLLAFEALQGSPRPARSTHGRSYCGRNRLWGRQHVAHRFTVQLFCCGWTCVTTSRKPWRCRTEKSGRAKSGRRDLIGKSTHCKAKFGKRHRSRKWEEENFSTRRHWGKERKRQKTPSPPHNVPHTPLDMAACFLCISQTPEMHLRLFFGGTSLQNSHQFQVHKTNPKTSILYLLVLIMTTISLSIMLMQERSRVSKACNRGASRLGEAWERRGEAGRGLFFSSSLADVALWLGPNMWVSSQNTVQGQKSP